MIRSRLKELEKRETELSAQAATLETDVELRQDKLEEREHELADLEQRLTRKETELAVYVAKVQSELQRREERLLHDRV